MSRIYAVVILTLFLAACGDSQKISLVQDSMLDSYPTTTIENAISAGFSNSSWKFFETNKGEQVVEFKGEVNESLASAAAKVTSQNELYLAALCSLYDEFLVSQSKPKLSEKQKQQTSEGILNLHPQVRSSAIDSYLEKIGKTRDDLSTEFDKYKTGKVFVGSKAVIQFTIIPQSDSFEVRYVEGLGGLEINQFLQAIYL